MYIKILKRLEYVMVFANKYFSFGNMFSINQAFFVIMHHNIYLTTFIDF